MATAAIDVTGGFTGEGNILFNRFDAAGNPTGFVDLGNVTNLEIKEASKVQRRISRQKGKSGMVASSIATKEPATLTLKTDEAGAARVMALALMASVTQGTSAAEIVVDEAVVAKLGNTVQLAKRDLDPATFVLKNSTGSKTYAAGVDYEIVSDTFSIIKFFENSGAGAIADGASLKASYSTIASGYVELAGGTSTTVRGALLFDGTNRDTGQAVTGEFFRVSFTPNSSVDLLTDAFLTVGLTGDLELPAGKYSPYVLRLKDVG